MTDTEKDDCRKMAGRCFNEVWTLLEKTDRTPEEDDRMIHAAHASRYHWGLVGNARHLAVGEWQIARVYSTLGRAEPALYHAKRCVRIAEENGFAGFYLASAYEGRARALAVNRDPAAAEWIARAKQIAADVAEPADKSIIDADIADAEQLLEAIRF